MWVSGLRQAGKTTLVRRIDPGRAYFTLDDLSLLAAAREDPQGFIQSLPRPVTLDEVQRVPELLLAIKREVDVRRRAGAFLLTGSSQIPAGRGVKETLAGRVALLRLRPLTWAEAAGNAQSSLLDLLFRFRSASELSAAFAGRTASPLDSAKLMMGGLPVPFLGRKGVGARERWFEQYRATYIEQDVPPLVRIEEVPAFVRFLSLAAARTAQAANMAALAHDAGVSVDTGVRWSALMEMTFLADRIPPYWRNIAKRLVKSPKLHIGDAGLAGHLAGVRGWGDARRLNVAGRLLETLVAQHLLAFADAARVPTRIFHYRTQAGAEVDFVLERGTRLLPIEVKTASTVRTADTRGLGSFLETFGRAAPFGLVLYGGAEAVPLARGLVALPLSFVLEGGL